jgi:bisphosphoglycerate-dependent phosphoglycerate mutase
MTQALDSRVVEILNKFFRSNIYRIPSREDNTYMDNYAHFMEAAKIAVHESIALQLSLAPITVSMESVELLVDGHGDSTTNDAKLITGHSGGPLSKKGIERAKHLGEEHSDFIPGIRVTSDAVRAIHHDLVRYCPNTTEDPRLKKLIAETPSSLEQNSGIVTRETQLGWIDYAIANGIIPTPLLRAQFYGIMELFPEKNDEDVLSKKETELLRQGLPLTEIKLQFGRLDAELKQNRQRCYDLQAERLKELNYDNSKIEDVLNWIKESLKQRNNKQFRMTDSSGKLYTENRHDMLARVKLFLSGFEPNGRLYDLAKGKRIQIVAHSGSNDAMITALQEYNYPDGVSVLKRAKQPERGESWLVQLGPSKGKGFSYVNDPTTYQGIVRGSYEHIVAFRESSPDQAIRKGKDIMPTGLYGLRRNENSGNDEKKSINSHDLISSLGPSLVLANAGLGKTTFCVDLATRLLPRLYEIAGGDLNKDSKIIPVLVRLRELPRKDGEYDLVQRILSSVEPNMNRQHVNTVLEQGKKFVFILDGYDELDNSLKSDAMWQSGLEEMTKLGKVIVTSRYERFSQYDTANLGFSMTVHIDPDKIIQNIEAYLATKISDPDSAKKLAEYIKKQRDDIQKNWLMLYFITDVYKREPGKIDLSREANSSEIIKAGIEWYVWDHSLRRNPELLPTRKNGEQREEFWDRYDAELKQRKLRYTEEIMPSVRKVMTYIFAVKNASFATAEEVQNILDDRWDLVSETMFRKGMRKDRFITAEEYASGLRASHLRLS